jgi:single-strand DNA-binding protein
MLPLVQFEARVVRDPELRFAQSGMAVAKIRCVSSSRKLLDDGTWVDDKTCWLDVTCFKKQAENVGESITKGDLIVVTGKLQTEEWETKDTHEKRSKITCVADSVGLALAFNAAKSMKAERVQPADPGGEDPWASPPAEGEPPF